mmetsp:Transcript_17707/g.55292  ORF Transcript_17707/g.55292 Transcript_17707/m.55292 type:complete len:284 (+) Transcript_17707:1514-2365(+)
MAARWRGRCPRPRRRRPRGAVACSGPSHPTSRAAAAAASRRACAPSPLKRPSPRQHRPCPRPRHRRRRRVRLVSISVSTPTRTGKRGDGRTWTSRSSFLSTWTWRTRCPTMRSSSPSTTCPSTPRSTSTLTTSGHRTLTSPSPHSASLWRNGGGSCTWSSTLLCASRLATAPRVRTSSRPSLRTSAAILGNCTRQTTATQPAPCSLGPGHASAGEGSATKCATRASTLADAQRRALRACARRSHLMSWRKLLRLRTCAPRQQGDSQHVVGTQDPESASSAGST